MGIPCTDRCTVLCIPLRNGRETATDQSCVVVHATGSLRKPCSGLSSLAQAQRTREGKQIEYQK